MPEACLDIAILKDRYFEKKKKTSKNGVLLMYTLESVSSSTNFITAYEESQ